MSQRDQILSMLENAGETGVTGSEFYAACLPRFAARIKELRDAGYRIVTERIDANHFSYKLLSDRTVGKGDRVDAQGVEHECGSLAGLERPAQSSNVRVVSPHSLGGPIKRSGLAAQGNGQTDGDIHSSSVYRLPGGDGSCDTESFRGPVARRSAAVTTRSYYEAEEEMDWVA